MMTTRMKKVVFGPLLLVTLVATGYQAKRAIAQNDEPEKPHLSGIQSAETDHALAHTRRTVKMLDDLYKTTIVLVTQTYVEDESSTPGITAAMGIWETMHKNGWHKVRLVDATGDPYEAENIAKSEFEKASIKKLTAKNGYIDTVVVEDGKRYLEAVTQVPMVMEKCILCHAHYADVPPGVPVGAISYRIPIDEVK